MIAPSRLAPILYPFEGYYPMQLIACTERRSMASDYRYADLVLEPYERDLPRTPLHAMTLLEGTSRNNDPLVDRALDALASLGVEERSLVKRRPDLVLGLFQLTVARDFRPLLGNVCYAWVKNEQDPNGQQWRSSVRGFITAAKYHAAVADNRHRWAAPRLVVPRSFEPEGRPV